MRILLLLSLLIPVSVEAQFDTAYLSKALNFLKSEKFVAEFRDSANAELQRDLAANPVTKEIKKRFKEAMYQKLFFWTDGASRCFTLKDYYFVPIKLNPEKKFSSNNFRKVFLDKGYFKNEIDQCHEVRIMEPYFTSQNHIEFHLFSGQKASISFGELYILRFRINLDASVTFISFDTISVN